MSSHPFRAAVERSDLAGMVKCLADDVVLHSPVTFHPFEGRDAVAKLFGILVEVFEDFRYTDEMGGEGIHGLVFRARIGDREVEGLDLIRDGPDGLITDFTVMVRPLSAAIALAEAVGPRLAASAEPAA